MDNEHERDENEINYTVRIPASHRSNTAETSLSLSLPSRMLSVRHLWTHSNQRISHRP